MSFTLSRAEKIGCLTLAYLYTHLPPERRGLWGGGGGGEGWARGETGQVSSSALGRRLELLALLEGGVWEEGEGWVLLNFPVLFSPLPVFHSLLIYSFPLSFSTKLRFDLYPRQVTTGRPSAPETNPPNPHPTTTEWIPMCPSTCVYFTVQTVMNLQKKKKKKRQDSGIVNERRRDKGRGGKVKVQFCWWLIARSSNEAFE